MLCSFTACAEKEYALKYNDTTISANEYLYWLSSYKTVFLSYYLNGNDSPELWDSEVDEGLTIENFLSGIALGNIKNNIICIDLFDEMGLKLSKDEINDADDYVNELIKKAGGVDALNNSLSAYGVNSKLLKEIYKNDRKIKLVQDKLFEEGGELAITDSDRDNFFNENYIRVKHIYINNVKDLARDEEGDLIIDSDTGTYKTRELTETEKAEKTALAETVYAEIVSGGDFDALMAEYGADTTMKVYKDGYYINSNTALLPPEVIEKAFTAAEGEVARVDSEIGIHIIKREPLLDKAYADENNSAFFSEFDNNLRTIKLTEFFNNRVNDVTVNKDVISSFSLKTCTANYLY